jgi:ABC-type cobalt transport system substrate-binding protein
VRRRGVELSLNLIILIVIGLIVAALIIYLVVRTTGSGGKDLTSCTSKGGQCRPQNSGGQSCDVGESESSLFSGGCNEGEVCCISQQGFTDGK